MNRLRVLLASIAVIVALTVIVSCAGSSGGGGNTAPGGSQSTSSTSESAVTTETPSAADSPTAPVIPDGFVEYTNNTLNFSMHYPVEWMVLDESYNLDDLMAEMNEMFGEAADDMMEVVNLDFSNIVVMWLDFENMTDDFCPNVNLVSEHIGSDITLNDLKLPELQSDVQDMFEELYQQIYDRFTSVSDIAGKAYGNNYFLIYQFEADLGGIEMSACQAITIVDEVMYTFTYTVPSGQMSAFINLFESMLPTFSAN